MLKIENLVYKLVANNEEKTILNGINFEFKLGKNYCITGANGCGKSTLAKVIMGILPATSGKIIFNDQDITHLDITERAKLGIAFAMQQPVKFKGLKAKDLLQISSGKNLSSSGACEFLSKVGLCARDYMERDLDSTLSGGELKRIEIATTLARNCKLNIYDEPEAGIDIWSFNSLVDIFNNSKENATNIIISHQEKIFYSADEILLLDEGKIVKHGKPDVIVPELNEIKKCTVLKEMESGEIR